ncbi:alpha/beta hydrolase [Mesorhizobium sp. BAC0120]|uniref:alpha/beta hydrolase n=1 Tax=Mesorhizobium sp. BAC0120 TaxID=3090670 RepID=UPI00298C2948|nr:alpha/beta hydrolase [Mesorhizobium sp. BAC0120]MDW6021369.1 alpha/beta hydrolase [Mesorhizobium sp. BAC0120]
MTSQGKPEIDGLHHGLPFLYRLHRPEHQSGEVLVLLHGSGPDETSMIPLGREIMPRATLLGVRGRIIQDGNIRWFTRITPTRFEQESIRTEADAFADFVVRAAEIHDLDLKRAVFLGYSNGANLVSSVMLMHPGFIRRAALLRAMPVLDHPPSCDLSKSRILVVAGASDVTYAPFAPELVALLRSHGAVVDARTVSSGHEFGAEDARVVREWLAGPAAALALSRTS